MSAGKPPIVTETGKVGAGKRRGGGFPLSALRDCLALAGRVDRDHRAAAGGIRRRVQRAAGIEGGCLTGPATQAKYGRIGGRYEQRGFACGNSAINYFYNGSVYDCIGNLRVICVS